MSLIRFNEGKALDLVIVDLLTFGPQAQQPDVNKQLNGVAR